MAVLPSASFVVADWQPFFSAEVSASAALAGLLFVALSINIRRIIDEGEWLPGRAGQSLTMLMTALLLASVALFPGLTPEHFGLASLVIVIGSALFSTRFAIAQFSVPPGYRGHMLFNFVLNAAFLLIGTLGSFFVMASGAAALAWIAAAILYALCDGMFNAWVLLVEILR
jgi:hypothetical protein